MENNILRIVSWNCRNGLGINKAKVIFAEFPKADIFVIQECRREDIYAFECDWKFKNWYGDDQEYSDLGIAVFSRNHEIEFTDTFNRNFRYVVPYEIKMTEGVLVLFVVWTKPVPSKYDINVIKAVRSDEYKDIISNAIIIGDFNTGRSENHPEYYTGLCKNLEKFTDCALEKPEKPNEFKNTYFSHSKAKMYLNDFCFISKTLYDKAKEIKFETRDSWSENDYKQKNWHGSDHCPIIIDFTLKT